jgi:hypothetical protein
MVSNIETIEMGAQRGWVVTLSCGHKRFFDTYPHDYVRCWECDHEHDKSESTLGS